MIKQCGCKENPKTGVKDAAQYQDRAYGLGRRVHNQKGSGNNKNSTKKYTCTVCGTERD